MIVDWTSEFDRWLDRLEVAAVNSSVARSQRDHIDAQLQLLQELESEPDAETASLRRVRQSRRYPLWRVSHPFDAGIAVRMIVWFPDDGHAVVALFAADKAAMGDVFYDSVGSRADAAIEKWMREANQ